MRHNTFQDADMPRTDLCPMGSNLNPSRRSGFTLVEMVIASAFVMALSAVFLNLLMVESGASRRLLTSMSERRWRERTRDLIRHDRFQALSESIDLRAATAVCPLASRTPVVHLETRHRPIAYTIAQRPSAIWHNPVITRYGPFLQPRWFSAARPGPEPGRGQWCGGGGLVGRRNGVTQTEKPGSMRAIASRLRRHSSPWERPWLAIRQPACRLSPVL